MGGSKCSYRNCNVAHNGDKKMRFFHYPLKDRARLEKWIINAQKPHFHTMPLEQLRNKVICPYHFEKKYFMNSRYDRLTHNAIPTLDQSGEESQETQLTDIQIVPLDTDKEDNQNEFAVVSTENEKIPSSNGVSLDLNHTENLESLSLIPQGEGSFLISSMQPLIKRVKLNLKNILIPSSNNTFDELIKPELHLDSEANNDSLEENEQIQVYDRPTESNNLTYRVTESGDLTLITSSENSQDLRSETSISVENIQLELSVDNPSTYSIRLDENVNNDNAPITNFEYVNIPTDVQSTNLINHGVENGEFILPDQEETDNHQEQIPIKKTHKRTRKEILFKHIAKDINPVLALALKMDLLNKKKWTRNDKQLALDLYHSTAEGYQVLVEQWGFKLPPIERVQKWSSEMASQ